MKDGDEDPAAADQLHGSHFATPIGKTSKLSPAAFDIFADAIEIAGDPNEKLTQIFDLRRILIE